MGHSRERGRMCPIRRCSWTHWKALSVKDAMMAGSVAVASGDGRLWREGAPNPAAADGAVIEAVAVPPALKAMISGGYCAGTLMFGAAMAAAITVGASLPFPFPFPKPTIISRLGRMATDAISE